MPGKHRSKADKIQREKLFELALLDASKPLKGKHTTRVSRYKSSKQIEVELEGDSPRRMDVASDTFPDERKGKGRGSKRQMKGVQVTDTKERDLLLNKISKFRGWRKKYLEELALSGDRNSALRKCGNSKVNALTIERACDPKNDGYDPAMAEQIEALEKALLWQIEDNYLDRALKDPNHAKQVLATRVGHRYAMMNEALRSAVGASDSTIHNHFWFTQDEQGKSVDMLHRLFPDRSEPLNVSEESKEDEQITIDVTPTGASPPHKSSPESQRLLEARGAGPKSDSAQPSEPFSSDGLVRSVLSSEVHSPDAGLETSGEAPRILLGE